MRKLAMIALGAAALLAQGVRAEDAAKERKEAYDATREQVKQEGREAKGEVDRSAQKTRDAMKDEKGDKQAASGEKKHPLFEGKDNFKLDGKIQKVSKNSITVQRDELPPATLMISPNTKIEIGGEHASTQQLKPGQEVKASFNLKGEKPEAVEIKAEKMEKK